MISTSRVVFFFALLLLAFTAFSNDLVSANALPTPNADLRFVKQGAISLQENFAGDSLLVPNAGCSEIEPNQSASTATPMTLPASCTGAAATSDPGDWIVTYSGGATDDIEPLENRSRISRHGDGERRSPAPETSTSSLPDLGLVGRGVGQLERHRHHLGVVHQAVTAGTYYVGVSAYTGSSATRST
jgi:hypothetical protein